MELVLERDVVPWLAWFASRHGYGTVTITFHEHRPLQIEYQARIRTSKQLHEDMKPVK